MQTKHARSRYSFLAQKEQKLATVQAQTGFTILTACGLERLRRSNRGRVAIEPRHNLTVFP